MLRSHIARFVSELQASGIPETQLEHILGERFGEPELLRELYLRNDSESAAWNDRACAGSLCGVTVLWAAAAALLKAAEFLLLWHAPDLAAPLSGSASAILLATAPMTGVASYVAHWIFGGNRYRVAPFVALSTLLFILAGSTRAELDILERKPAARYHILLSAAIPIVGASFRPLIRRMVLDFDHSGLPEKFTRARPFVTVQEEIPSGTVRFFWLLAAAVAIGNTYVLGRMADDLALLGDL